MQIPYTSYLHNANIAKSWIEEASVRTDAWNPPFIDDFKTPPFHKVAKFGTSTQDNSTQLAQDLFCIKTVTAVSNIHSICIWQQTRKFSQHQTTLKNCTATSPDQCIYFDDHTYLIHMTTNHSKYRNEQLV